jgi:hypothetical protein
MVEELLGQITPELMEWVGDHWIERLNQLINTPGDSIERRLNIKAQVRSARERRLLAEVKQRWQGKDEGK